MRILFSYYLPSGGMETLNRLRAETLIKHGVVCHLHYQWPGAGLQNNISSVPTFVTNEDDSIRQMIAVGQYDAVVISSDCLMMQRFHQLGYTGKMIFETQGLGQRHQAAEVLLEWAPLLRSYSHAVLYPNTAHLIELFQGMFSDVRQFHFDNLLDTERFGYHTVPIHPAPIIGWVGRIEVNKNWRAYLKLGAAIRRSHPQAELWMFEDATLGNPAELAAFNQLVEELGLASAITRRSNIPHMVMSDYYSIIGESGGLLASTSITEGFGYAVAEAMLCRCPVLAADSDGVRVFINHDQTGKFYLQGDDEAALREALSLIGDQGLRERIRTDGRQHILNRFSPGLYGGQFLRMMQALGIS